MSQQLQEVLRQLQEMGGLVEGQRQNVSQQLQEVFRQLKEAERVLGERTTCQQSRDFQQYVRGLNLSVTRRWATLTNRLDLAGVPPLPNGVGGGGGGRGVGGGGGRGGRGGGVPRGRGRGGGHY